MPSIEEAEKYLEDWLGEPPPAPVDRRRSTGRPKFEDGKARDVVLQTRVTRSELGRLRKAAKADGQDLSAWVRDVMLRRIQR